MTGQPIHDAYTQRHLSHATPAELAQYTALLQGCLPAGFDAANAADWVSAIGRIKRASDARQRAEAVLLELGQPDPMEDAAEAVAMLPAARPAIQGLPQADRQFELSLARRWMTSGANVARQTYFDHASLAAGAQNQGGLPQPE